MQELGELTRVGLARPLQGIPAQEEGGDVPCVCRGRAGLSGRGFLGVETPPRVGVEGPKGAHIGEARRAATRAPTPLHTAPAPTRYPTLLQKPMRVRLHTAPAPTRYPALLQKPTCVSFLGCFWLVALHPD